MGRSRTLGRGLEGLLPGSSRRRCRRSRCCRWGALGRLRRDQQAQLIQPTSHLGQALPLGRLGLS